MPWDSGGVTASHALRCALPPLPGAAPCSPLMRLAGIKLSAACLAPGVVKGVWWRVVSCSGVLTCRG